MSQSPLIMEYEPDYAPKFQIGQIVYFISETGYYQDTIRSIILESVPGEDGNYRLACIGYTLSKYPLFGDETGVTRPQQLISDEEEVKHLTNFTPVVLTAQEWQTAIGEQEDESDEDSELGVCCEVIDEVRDILLGIKKNHGLIERDRLILKNHATNHPIEPESGSVLSKIWTQLRLW